MSLLDALLKATPTLEEIEKARARHKPARCSCHGSEVCVFATPAEHRPKIKFDGSDAIVASVKLTVERERIQELLRRDRAPFALARAATVLAWCENKTRKANAATLLISALVDYESRRPAYARERDLPDLRIGGDDFDPETVTLLRRVYERARDRC